MGMQKNDGKSHGGQVIGGIRRDESCLIFKCKSSYEILRYGERPVISLTCYLASLVDRGIFLSCSFIFFVSYVDE